MNDHDLLTRISEKVENIEQQLENHLATHTKISVAAFSAAAAAILALVIMILKMA